jgi:glyoxylase-like metal-dependent hydrolase (beta-lactamase superfamily II)
MTIALPAGIQVFERGWLSANNILCRDTDETVAGVVVHHTLIDSGYVTHAEQTVALLRQALNGASLTRIINTHLHSDHCGGNAALQEAWSCQIAIPVAETKAVETWDESLLSYRATGQQCPRFRHSEVLTPGDILQLGGHNWHVYAAPGHDPHAILLFAPEPRVLIAGDALWQHGFGALFPELDGDGGFAEQRSVLQLIATLDAKIVIPGHGPMFTDVSDALARAHSRLDYLEADPRRNAQHAMRVLIKFWLLQRKRVADVELLSWMVSTDYIERVRVRFYDDAPMLDLMQEAIQGLVKTSAVRVEAGTIIDQA